MLANLPGDLLYKQNDDLLRRKIVGLRIAIGWFVLDPAEKFLYQRFYPTGDVDVIKWRNDDDLAELKHGAV